MNSFKSFERENNVEIINRMQVVLAQRFYGQYSSETMTQWIDNYSSKFREIVDNNPEYINSFNNNPEEVLEEIEKNLYDFHSQDN